MRVNIGFEGLGLDVFFGLDFNGNHTLSRLQSKVYLTLRIISRMIEGREGYTLLFSYHKNSDECKA